MSSQAHLTAQWIIAHEKVAQAEARLANLIADKESIQDKLHKLLGEEGFCAFYDSWLLGEEVEQPGVCSDGKIMQTGPR